MWTDFWTFLTTLITNQLTSLWTIFLSKVYVVIWTFGKPPPPVMSTWFMNAPIAKSRSCAFRSVFCVSFINGPFTLHISVWLILSLNFVHINIWFDTPYQYCDAISIGKDTVSRILLTKRISSWYFLKIVCRMQQNDFLHSMEKKSTKVDFSPISCKKAPFYTRNGHF